MSHTLNRIIEVKLNGEWECLKYYVPFYERWEGEKPTIESPFPMREIKLIWGSTSEFEEIITDSGEYGGRGLPEDCSEEAKKIVDEYEYAASTTYLTTEELNTLLAKERTKAINNIVKSVEGNNFKVLNEKIDSLLEGKPYVDKKKLAEERRELMEELNDAYYDFLRKDMTEEAWLTVKKRIEEKIGIKFVKRYDYWECTDKVDEEEFWEDSLEMLNHYQTEGLWLYEALVAEEANIARLVNDYAWVNGDNARIIYFIGY